jgi:cation diffusion facilitator family transporter
MDIFSRWLQKKFVEEKAIKKNADSRMLSGILEAWVSIIGNIVLFIVKLLIGLLTSSISIIADAFHTLSDVVSSMVVLVGFKYGSKEPDQEHPYGHGRLEIIATLVIAILLILTGIEFLKSSIQRFRNPVPVSGGWWVLVILLISAFVKEWMARFSWSLGENIDSSALKADAWHHRSDAIASALVAIGNVAAVKGLVWVDPLFGLAVSILIIYTGYEFAASSGNRLLGLSPSEVIVKEIFARAKSVSGVEEVHKVKIHDYGNHKEISLHIEVDRKMDLVSAHALSEVVEKVIAEKFNAKTVVHIEPLEQDKMVKAADELGKGMEEA